MDHPSEQHRPPRSADRFLRWFCRDELHEEIMGDLYEYYREELQGLPSWKATLLYWYHVLHFLRPFALKRVRQFSKFVIMHRSNFKFAWRNMKKHKGSTFMNVLTLSLGIACFIFIFVFLRGELSYDKFHQDADRIHRIVIDFVNSKGERLPDATTPPALAPNMKKDFPEVEEAVRIFPGWGSRFLLGRSDSRKFYEEDVIRTDSNFFKVFSFPLLYGDPNTALAEPDNLVITRSVANKYFGEENVVGETLTHFASSGNRIFTISGVLEDIPPNSHFTFDFLGRITFQNLEQNWGWYNYYTYVKLKPEARMASLEPKLQPFYESYQEDEDGNYNIIYSQPLTDIHLQSDLKWELAPNGDINDVYIFSMLAIFVLIISCLNYLSLSIADSLKRFKEVGVRKVLGANKPYLVGQFLAETLLITLISLGLATLLAEVAFKNLADLLGREVSIFTPPNLPFYIGLCVAVLLIGILAGLYPAIHLSSFNPALAVKGMTRRSGQSVVGLRRVLLVGQFAISAFMIFCTIGVYRQMQHVKNKDKGFNAEQVLVLDNVSNVQNQRALKNELQKLPGVSTAGYSDGVVGGQNWTTQMGYPDPVLVNYVVIDPEFIETMDFEFKAGRNFSRRRPGDTVGYTVIVNETGLEALGLSYDDVGKSVPLVEQPDSNSAERGTVIGVVSDFHFTNFKSEIKPYAFFYRETPLNYLNLQISGQNASQTLAAIEKTWYRFAQDIPLEYTFLDDTFAELHAKESKLSRILLFLTALAIFIAFMGMFASARISIKARRKEISIRKVLGASVSGVTYMITQNFLWLVLVANLVAIPLSFFVMEKWLQGFAYRTSVGFTIILVTILSTLVVAVATVGVQSFRAALSNPVKNLKEE